MKDITPSKEPVTEGQIGRLNENIAELLRKRKNELTSDIFQELLEDETLIDDIDAAVRKRIEARDNMITRSVKVDRTRSPKEALDATGREQYTMSSVLNAMPKGEGDEVEVVFFKLSDSIRDNDLAKEYKLRRLIPADPYSLAAVNEADPAFADEHPNGTHWKDNNDNWCYAAFSLLDDERGVGVERSDIKWSGGWFFAVLRKKN